MDLRQQVMPCLNQMPRDPMTFLPPRKRFGQNFLHDKMVIQQIVQSVAPEKNDHLVEIGPGRGALTLPLLKTGCRLDVIEIDRDMIAPLTALCAGAPNFTLHQADALVFDFGLLVSAGEQLRIVGNLPYNISTPLLFHLLKSAGQIADMHFMLQKEVADRLAANPGTRDYGRLSVMVQYCCRVSLLFDVEPESFSPQPKVRSSVIRLQPYQEKPFQAKDEKHFAELVKTAFSQRRKTLRNNLKKFMEIPEKEASPVDFQLRPEQISVAEYVALSNLA